MLKELKLVEGDHAVVGGDLYISETHWDPEGQYFNLEAIRPLRNTELGVSLFWFLECYGLRLFQVH